MEEPIERPIESADVRERGGQNRPKRVAYITFVANLGKLQRPGGLLQLERSDEKAMIAPQRRAKGGEILRKAREGISHRCGVETEPSPKSVSRLWPPGFQAAPLSRIGASASRCASRTA